MATEKANKMYVVHQESKALYDGMTLELGQVYCYPIYWPSTDATNLVNRFKEIAAELGTAVQGMDPRERIQYMHEHVLTKPMQFYMQTCPVSAAAIGSLEGLRKNPLRPWRYEHLQLQGGAQGWHATNCAITTPPPPTT